MCIAITCGKLIQEINTKKAVCQCLLNSSNKPVCIKYSKVPNKINAPMVKGIAFIKSGKSFVCNFCFKYDQPFILCWPIKYNAKEVINGSWMLIASMQQLINITAFLSHNPQNIAKQINIKLVIFPSISVNLIIGIFKFPNIKLVSTICPNKMIANSNDPQLHVIRGLL